MCSDGKNFAVIYLPNEKIYSEIPVAWLTTDRGHCWWPNSLNPAAVMARGEMPDFTAWKLHECTVDKYCSTLENARKAAADPNFNSSESEGPRGRGFRKKTQKVGDSSSSSEDFRTLKRRTKDNRTCGLPIDGSSDDTSDTLTPPPVKENMFEEGMPRKVVDNIIFDVTDIPEDSRGKQEDFIYIPEQESGETKGATLQDVFNLLVKVSMTCTKTLKYVEDISTTVNSITCEKGSFLLDENMNNLRKKLPLTNHEEIKNFEKEIESCDILKKSFISYMTSVGGKDSKENTNKCLSLIFTNEVGVSCSWYGQRGNFQLNQFSFMKILVDVIVSQNTKYAVKFSDVEKIINEWFRLAKQRATRKSIRS